MAKPKAAKPADTIRVAKSTVIHFRLTPAQTGVLEDALAASSIVDVSSTHQLARKYVLDALSGRLAYKDKRHANENPDLVQ